MTYLYLITFWVLYFVLHSSLATFKAKELLSLKTNTHRILYNILSIIGLLAILFWMAIQDVHYFWMQTTVSKFIGLSIATFGILVLKKAFKLYSTKQFLGLEPSKEQKLIREGILNTVRHPIYTGTIFLTIGYFIFSPHDLNLISALCLIFYICIGIQLEERKLIQLFGNQYLDYKKEVPMIFPKNFNLLRLFK